jgi:hypothetical protein
MKIALVLLTAHALSQATPEPRCAHPDDLPQIVELNESWKRLEAKLHQEMVEAAESMILGQQSAGSLEPADLANQAVLEVLELSQAKHASIQNDLDEAYVLYVSSYMKLTFECRNF